MSISGWSDESSVACGNAPVPREEEVHAGAAAQLVVQNAAWHTLCSQATQCAADEGRPDWHQLCRARGWRAQVRFRLGNPHPFACLSRAKTHLPFWLTQAVPSLPIPNGVVFVPW